MSNVKVVIAVFIFIFISIVITVLLITYQNINFHEDIEKKGEDVVILKIEKYTEPKKSTFNTNVYFEDKSTKNVITKVNDYNLVEAYNQTDLNINLGKCIISNKKTAFVKGDEVYEMSLNNLYSIYQPKFVEDFVKIAEMYVANNSEDCFDKIVKEKIKLSYCEDMVNFISVPKLRKLNEDYEFTFFTYNNFIDVSYKKYSITITNENIEVKETSGTICEGVGIR